MKGRKGGKGKKSGKGGGKAAREKPWKYPLSSETRQIIFFGVGLIFSRCRLTRGILKYTDWGFCFGTVF